MNGVNDIIDELENANYDEGNELIAWLREKADVSDFISISARLREMPPRP